MDQVPRDHGDKVNVERRVDEQVNDLFAAVPAVVDPNVPVRYLQAGGDPDHIDRDVYGGDQRGHADLEAPDHVGVVDEDGAAVDDDL